MAMATSYLSFSGLSSFSSSKKIELQSAHPSRFNFSIQSKARKQSEGDGGAGGGRGRQVWRRRKLTKKDEYLPYKLERVPFLEEHVRKIRDGGKLLTMDIERMLLSEDNRFGFVNEVAAEAKRYVENNPDAYWAKKAVLEVLSNRMNDAGYYRPDGYIQQDPFKPGPGYLRDEVNDQI